MASNKQYGLHIPKKANQGLTAKHIAFGASDSEESDGGGDWMKKAAKKDFSSTASKRQSKLEIEKALKEDATVFLYDEIYDDIDQQKQSNSGKEKEKKPKYVQKLLVAAEKRKVENERRYERQVQKEREAEGDEFKDKETFVTSAYKKKLEEFAKLDAEQKRQDMLEEIGDVTKQQDISGFYRHLYQTTMEDNKSDVDEQPSEQNSGDIKDTADQKPVGRQYRKRKDLDSSADKDKDADSNFDSSSSSSSSSDDSEDSDDVKSTHSDTEDPKRIRLKKYKDSPIKPQTSPKSDAKTDSKKKTAGIEVKKQPPVPPVDIWKKRTIGTVFEEALKRYLERKSGRVGTAA